MTQPEDFAYSPPMLNGWQHTGAFVIQFRSGNLSTELFEGRVEHVASGQSTHFHSQEDLLEFLRRVLQESRAEQLRQTQMPAEEWQPTITLAKRDDETTNN